MNNRIGECSEVFKSRKHNYLSKKKNNVKNLYNLLSHGLGEKSIPYTTSGVWAEVFHVN